MKLKGLIAGFFAAATYGMNPLFALPLYGEGLDANSVLLLRYAAALPILWLMAAVRGRSLRLCRNEILPLVALGLLLGMSSYGLFASYNYMDAGVASTMLFIYPLIVALIMAGLYKERLSMQTIVCLIVALAGIWLLSRNSHGATLSATGVMWVMVSAISYAVYIVAVNRCSAVSGMPTVKLTFYVLLFGMSIFVAGIVAGDGLTVPASARGWGCVAALALLPTAMSLSLTTLSIQYIGSTLTAILGVFEPVTAVFFGIAVFGERLDARQATGLAMILIAVTAVVAGGNLPHLLTRFRKLFPSLRKSRRK